MSDISPPCEMALSTQTINLTLTPLLTITITEQGREELSEGAIVQGELSVSRAVCVAYAWLGCGR